MPIFTCSHCIVCYQWHDSKNPTLNSSSSPRTFLKLRNRNGEICHRFGILSSRYLDLDPYLYAPEKTARTKLGVHFDTVCDQCRPMLSSFCDLYRQWEFIQMQMNWRLHEISEVMRRSDVDGRHTEFRKEMEAKFKGKGGGPEDLNDLDDFRREFLEAALEKQSEFAPHLKLNRNDDEDDATVKKKSCGSQQEPEPVTNQEKDATKPSPPKKIVREDKDIVDIEREINETETDVKVNGHHDHYHEDDFDDDLFDVVITKKKKRKKSQSPMKKGKSAVKKHYRERRDRDPTPIKEGQEDSRGGRGRGGSKNSAKMKPRPKSSKSKKGKIETVEMDLSSSPSVSDKGGAGMRPMRGPKLKQHRQQAHINNVTDAGGRHALCDVPFCGRRLSRKDSKSGRFLKYWQLKDDGVRKIQFLFQELGIAIPRRLNPLAKKCVSCSLMLSRITLRDDICSNQTGRSVRHLIKVGNKRMYKKLFF